MPSQNNDKPHLRLLISQKQGPETSGQSADKLRRPAVPHNKHKTIDWKRVSNIALYGSILAGLPLAAVTGGAYLLVDQHTRTPKSTFKVPVGSEEMPQLGTNRDRLFATTAQKVSEIVCAQSFTDGAGNIYDTARPVNRRVYYDYAGTHTISNSSVEPQQMTQTAIVACSYPESAPSEIQSIPVTIIP